MKWLANRKGGVMVYVLLCLSIFLLFVPAALKSFEYGDASQRKTTNQMKATQISLSAMDAISKYIESNRYGLDCKSPSADDKVNFFHHGLDGYSDAYTGFSKVTYVDTEGQLTILKLDKEANYDNDGVRLTTRANIGKDTAVYEYDYKRQPLNASTGLTQIAIDHKDRQVVCEENRIYLNENINTHDSRSPIDPEITVQNHTELTYPLGKNMPTLISEAINTYERKIPSVPSRPAITAECQSGVCQNIEELNEKIRNDRHKTVVIQVSSGLLQNSSSLIKNSGKKLVIIVPGTFSLNAVKINLEADIYTENIQLNQSTLRLRGSLYATQNVNLINSTLGASENVTADSLILNSSTVSNTSTVRVRNLQALDAASKIICSELFVLDRTQHPPDMRITANRLFFIGDAVYTPGNLSYISTETLVVKNTLNISYTNSGETRAIGNILTREALVQGYTSIRINGDFMVVNNLNMSNTCEGEIRGSLVVGGKMNITPTEARTKWYMDIGEGITQLLINGGTSQWGLSPKV